jgi:hypothetical protein
MKQKNSVIVSPEHQARIKALIDKVGTSQACRFLEVSLHAMERACGGLPVHRMTAGWLGLQITKRDAEGKNP